MTPRILVIDDQLGGLRLEGRNRIREDFCLTVGVRDVTGDARTEEVPGAVAEAVFCRGQLMANGMVLNDLEGTISSVRNGWETWPRWSLVLLDMQFKTGRLDGMGEPEGRPGDSAYFGLSVLEALWRDGELRNIPIVVLSSMARDQIEQRFSRHGVFDFVDKTQMDRARLAQTLDAYGLIQDSRVIGRSVKMLMCLREARQRARIGTDNILLLGESGTGKELVARYIHDHSPHRAGPYVTAYTQGVPETLIDDRLFGHERGAFNEARVAQSGAAEEADGGTLFIDEFGDIPPMIQPKLLRLLDKNIREVQRLGAHAPVRRLTLQVVLATNRLDLMNTDDFRKDLLFRVQINDAIPIPNLHDRREDIPLLAEHFVRKAERSFSAALATEERTISGDAMAALCSAEWPDNVRGLEQVIERAVYRYPRLRVLAVPHLTLRRTAATLVTVGAGPVGGPEAWHALDEVVDRIGGMALGASQDDRVAWTGKLPALLTASARAAAAVLRAALIATRKPTPRNPQGEIKVHPAVKLAMGDDSITASAAADIIKRVLSMDRSVADEIRDDPVLSEALTTAIRLRPGKRGARKG